QFVDAFPGPVEHHMEGIRAAIERLAPRDSGQMEPGAPRSAPQAPTLPAQLSRFIGRAVEVSAIEKLVAKGRLTTLSGPGGSGKTRLAIEVAVRARDQLATEIVFADLSSLTDSALVMPTLAALLDVQESGGRSAQDAVTEGIQDRDLLLVLDNVEQLRE